MRRSAGTLVVFALLVFLSSSATAREADCITDSASPFFSFSSPDPADFIQEATQASGFLPKAPAKLQKPMTSDEKWHFYLKSTYGPGSFAYSLVGAGTKQARNAVPEWGQGMEGYSKRFGSNFGQKVIENSVRFGLGSLFKEDPRYFPSNRSGIIRRALYAAKEELVTHKDSGDIRPGYTRFIAATAGVLVARRWYPEADRTVGRCIGAIAISITLAAGKNVFNEFWPDIKRKLHH
jgi:hypothetical protein